MTLSPVLVEMEVKGLMMDPNSNVPIVILRSRELAWILPIWIGPFEANAIALSLEGVEAPRPMTHDLLLNSLTDLDAKVLKVIINDLIENTFFAQLVVQVGSEKRTIDSRPSDAIALALRADVSIFVAEKVLERAKIGDLSDQTLDKEKLKKWLEEVDPDDLGKYTM